MPPTCVAVKAAMSVVDTAATCVVVSAPIWPALRPPSCVVVRVAISVVEIELARLGELMDARQLIDMKTLVLVQALKLRHPGLFA